MILGIDYGRSHLGLAISEGELAEPKETLEIKDVRSGIMDIGKRVRKWGIVRIVVGLSEGKMAEETRQWGEKLGKMLQLPVEFIDETLSSIEAGNLKDKSKHNHVDHARAAAVILQRYIDEMKNDK